MVAFVRFSTCPIKTWRYMANREVRSDVSQDLTRESLIALSYSLPDIDHSATDNQKSSLKNVMEAVNADEKDKVRSELISISYADSPDTIDLPVSPAKTKG